MWPPDNLDLMLAPLRVIWKRSPTMRSECEYLAKAVKSAPLSPAKLARLLRLLRQCQAEYDAAIYLVRDPDDEDLREFGLACRWGDLKVLAPLISPTVLRDLAGVLPRR